MSLWLWVCFGWFPAWVRLVLGVEVDVVAGMPRSLQSDRLAAAHARADLPVALPVQPDKCIALRQVGPV
jgi:hypothetical protein